MDTTWKEINDILSYNPDWNKLHDYYKLTTFTKYMRRYRKIAKEEKEKK